MRKLVALLHVPKTGGTSVSNWLQHHVAVDTFRSPWSWLPANMLNAMLKSTYPPDFIEGHNIAYVPQLEVEWGIILREPAEWLVSVYHNDMMDREKRGEEVLEFDKWYDSEKDNYVLPLRANRNRFVKYLRRWFGKEATYTDMRKALDSFRFVFTTDNLSEDVKQLAEYLGVPADMEHVRKTGEYDPWFRNTITKRYTLADDMKAKIYRDNERDVELYQYGVSRR